MTFADDFKDALDVSLVQSTDELRHLHADGYEYLKGNMSLYLYCVECYPARLRREGPDIVPLFSPERVYWFRSDRLPATIRQMWALAQAMIRSGELDQVRIPDRSALDWKAMDRVRTLPARRRLARIAALLLEP